MSAGFEPPPGDPGAIDTALTGLGGVVTDLTTQERRLRDGVEQAQTTWKAARKADFVRAGTGLLTQTGGARTSVDGAIEVLGRYAAALRTGRDDVADLARQAGKLPDADPEVAKLRHEAEQVRLRVRRLAGEAAAALDRATTSVVPGGADLSPDDLRARVATAYGVGTTRVALAGATLTAAQAWSALAGAQVSAPPDDWRTWAEQYGLDVPDHLDTTRGLAVKAQLERVLADSLSLPDDQRAAYLQRHFTDTVSEQDLVQLAMVDPALVGNLDGLPNAVRYTANKVNLFHAVATENAKLDAWQPPPEKADPAYVGWDRLQGRIDTMTKLLHDQPLTQGSSYKPPAQVLAFTPPTYDGFTVTDDGRLAVAVGDLDTAAHVGVFVPGITNRIDNFRGTLDSAVNIQQTAGKDSATVAWLGYDTPEFHDAVTDDDAIEGGQNLHAFMAGLQRSEDSDLTLVAHSYGSFVASKALQLGKDAPPIPDRVVVFGSPGFGEDVHSTADLGLPPGYPIYALRAPGDPVSITAVWGTDPVDLPGVTRLDTDWTDDGTEPTGHSQYTSLDTDSLLNIAGVLKGVPVSQLHVGGSALDEGLLGRYNVNLRNLVDELQQQVPSDVQSDFALRIEAELELRIETGTLVPGSPADLRDLTDLVRDAAHDSGLTEHLTQDEFQQAVEDAGFTDQLGDQVHDSVESWFDRHDELDGLPIPLGPGGPVLHLPDGLNELAGGLAGDGSGWVSEHVSDWAVEHLPSLDQVLDASDAVAGAWQTFVDTKRELGEAWQDVQDAPGEIWDRTTQAWDATTDAAGDAWDETKDVAGDAWDKATGWIP